MKAASTTRRRAWWRRVPLSAHFLCALGLLCAFTPLLPLAAPARIDLDRARQAPSLAHFWRPGFQLADLREPSAWERALGGARVRVFGDREIGPILGTDALGRCMLSRLLHGGRLSLLVSGVATLIALVLGVGYGAWAGLRGGRTDVIMMRVVDGLYSLPLIFLVIFVVTFVRGVRQADPSSSLDPMVVLFAVIGGVSWLVMARVVRAEVLRLRERGFVESARLANRSSLSILLAHLLPNLMPVVLVTLTLSVPRVLLLEAFLSFLGLGVEPPGVSWGTLAREGFDALNPLVVEWWTIVFPALAIGATLLGMNTLGDRLRDHFDVTLAPSGRRTRGREGPA